LKINLQDDLKMKHDGVTAMLLAKNKRLPFLSKPLSHESVALTAAHWAQAVAGEHLNS
jgi:hypothetical protein